MKFVGRLRREEFGGVATTDTRAIHRGTLDWRVAKRRVMHDLAECGQGLTFISNFYAKSSVDVAMTCNALADASLAESY